MMFKNGGSGATLMTPTQYVEAHQKSRMRIKMQNMIDFLGEGWLNHPENTTVNWGFKSK